MQISPKEINKIVEKCLWYLDKNAINATLIEVGVSPQEVKQACNLKKYYTYVVKYLINEDKLDIWLKLLTQKKIPIVKNT